MTKSQINKLGERLRAPGPPAPDDLAMLQAFRMGYDVPLAGTQVSLRERLGVPAASRLKTINTIVEKLRRERTRLAEMQDIAGLRVVCEGGRGEQDALVARVRGLFQHANVVDRRERPKHGYRAVHVIASVDDHPVEVQIRTSLQDHWAQAMERLADEVGRGIRYGERPTSRGEEVTQLLAMSDLIAGAEVAQLTIQRLDPDRALDPAGTRARIIEAEEVLEAFRARIRVLLG